MSTTPQAIYQRLYNAVSAQHGVPLHCSLSPETNFVRDLDADSLDLVELVMAVEDEFGIEISDEVGERLYTMNDAFLHVCGALLTNENSQQLEAVLLEVGEADVKVADLTESQMRWMLCKVAGLPLPTHGKSVDWALVGPLVSKFQVSMSPQVAHGKVESWTCKTHANPSSIQSVGEGTAHKEDQLFAAAAAVLDLLYGNVVRVPKVMAT